MKVRFGRLRPIIDTKKYERNHSFAINFEYFEYDKALNLTIYQYFKLKFSIIKSKNPRVLIIEIFNKIKLKNKLLKQC